VRARLTVAVALLVLVPLGALTWLGVRLAQDERDRLRDGLLSLESDRLADSAGRVAGFLERRRSELEALTRFESEAPAALREVVRRAPHVRQLFALSADGELAYPSEAAARTPAERDFVLRTQKLRAGGDLFVRPDEDRAGGARSGWYTWYWENGLHVLYWRRAADGRVVGAELDRVRLLADLVGELPNGPQGGQGRTALVDARGAPIYQWGPHEPGPGDRPRLERALDPPLAAWRLLRYLPASATEPDLGGGTRLALVAGLSALGLALLGLGLFVVRESARELAAAARRVSFVNQVSHELKTPLTNIRMYAELLERRLDPEDERASRHVGIIVAESRRLSRLIGNVLTFSRQQRDALVLHTAPGCLDQVAAEVLDGFGPSLEQRGVRVAFAPGAPDRVRLDSDVVAQILANLVSNVEKYAAGGGRLEVETTQRDDAATVTVRDEGPGIPPADAPRVFRPFVRLHDALTEGVAGTGLGLALARDLARLHGGDLIYVPSETGACFQLTLHTPVVDDEGPDR